jgi:hypothetical protein
VQLYRDSFPFLGVHCSCDPFSLSEASTSTCLWKGRSIRSRSRTDKNEDDDDDDNNGNGLVGLLHGFSHSLPSQMLRIISALAMSVTNGGWGGDQKMSAKEKVDFKRKMANIDKAGVDDGQSPPPSLTPNLLTSSNCFKLLFLSILCVLIDLCGFQSQQPRVATNISILQRLKNGTNAHQNRANRTNPRRTHQADSVSRLMVQGQGHPTTGSGQTRVQLGTIGVQ